MATLLDDVRFGVRLLLGKLGFTAVTVLTLALGIAVPTTMFSFLDNMYWNACPGAADTRRLFQLETVAQDGAIVKSSWLDFRVFRDRLQPAASVAAYTTATFNAGIGESARPLRGELVSSNYFEVLGIQPALGRLLSWKEHAENPGAHPLAVISHRFWQTQFGGHDDVLGKTVRVNRRSLTVIGVAPARFQGSSNGMYTDVWVPFTMGADLGAIEKDTFADSALRNVYMFARLRPGADPAEIRAQAIGIAAQIAAAEPMFHRGFSATLEPMWRARIHNRDAFLQPLLVLIAVSLLILLIVCANVGNLLLARSVGRLREFGVRIALGAGRFRLARLLFTEAMLLAGAATVVGVPAALWMTDAVFLLIPKIARAGTVPVPMDLRILLFSVMLCVAAAAISSVTPVLLVLRHDVNETLRDGGRSGRLDRRSHRLRSVLVVSEVALALVVLVGAGLFFRAYRNVQYIDPGFNRNGVLLTHLTMASGGYSVEELESFCLRYRSRLEADPAVEAVSYADYAPLWATDGPYTLVRPEGFVPRTEDDLKVHRTSVSPGYFALLRIPILEGRDFTESDLRKTEPVMVVDQAFARRFYGGASPVGRKVLIRKKVHTVVGLVRDSKYFSFVDSAKPHYYLPFRQSYFLGQHIVFFTRVKGDPEAAVAMVRREASSIDPNAASLTAAPLAEYNAVLLLPLKVAASLLAVLGGIALVLAGIGLYALMSYSVTQRTQELGIRIALGASGSNILSLVVRHGVLLTAVGVAAGLGLALASMRVLSTFLVGVEPFDPATFALAAGFLAAVATVAAALPALRAMRVDPQSALRDL